MCRNFKAPKYFFEASLKRAALKETALFFLITTVASIVSAEEINVSGIKEVARRLTCSPMNVSSNEQDKLMIVRGYSAGKKGESPDSTIFWCDQSNNTFLLVFMKNGQLYHSSCPPYLAWNVHPRGLRLTYKQEKLSTYQYYPRAPQHFDNSISRVSPISKPKRGPNITVTNGMVIEDGDTSVSSFYCYKGSWLTKILD